MRSKCSRSKWGPVVGLLLLLLLLLTGFIVSVRCCLHASILGGGLLRLVLRRGVARCVLRKHSGDYLNRLVLW